MSTSPALQLKQRDVRNQFRLLLSEVRAEAIADSESADRVIFAIENLGRFIYGQDAALEKVAPALTQWVASTLGTERAESLGKKLDLMRRGRNDRMHKGFAARSLTTDAVRVAIILEDALKVDWNVYQAQDLMTPNPLVAKEWHTFAMVRDALIENAYSHLPVFTKDAWHVISDRSVAALARRARQDGIDLRNVRLSEVPKSRTGFATLMMELATPATSVALETSAMALDLDTGCVLVTRVSDSGAVPDLVGIITPSDVA